MLAYGGTDVEPERLHARRRQRRRRRRAATTGSSRASSGWRRSRSPASARTPSTAPTPAASSTASRSRAATSSRAVLEVYYQPDSFVSDNSPDTRGRDLQVRGLRPQPRRPDREGQALVLRQRRVLAPGSTTPVGAVDTSDRKIPRFLGKLTYQLNDKNRIFAMGEYDQVTNERRGINALHLPRGDAQAGRSERDLRRELGVDPQLLELPQREADRLRRQRRLPPLQRSRTSPVTRTTTDTRATPS